MFDSNTQVYDKTGEVYVFDHAVGEWAYVYRTFRVQTLNYDGTDFEEFEETDDHLVRHKLADLKAEPWIKYIEEESDRLISERNAQLDQLKREIGQARIEARLAETALLDAKREYEGKFNALTSEYTVVRRLRQLLGKENSVMLMEREDPKKPPYIANVNEVRLKSVEGKLIFVDGRGDVCEPYLTEQDARGMIRTLFSQVKETLTAEEEAYWHDSHGFLDVSEEAKVFISDRDQAKLQRKFDAAKAAAQKSAEALLAIKNQAIETGTTLTE